MIRTLYKHEPDYAVPPGETLEEVLEELEMSQAELATRTGLSPKHVNQVIRGHVALASWVRLTELEAQEVARGPYDREAFLATLQEFRAATREPPPDLGPWLQKMLVPEENEHRLPTLRSLADIRLFAEELGIAPGIVVGRLQHDSVIPFRIGNRLKRRLEFSA